MARVSTLLDLANLAIQNPDIGVVNCRALQTLLCAILKHLDIEDEKVEIPEEDWHMYKPPGKLAKVEEVQYADKAPVEDQSLMEKHHANEDTVCKDPQSVWEGDIKVVGTGLGLQGRTVDDTKNHPVLQKTNFLHRGVQDLKQEKKLQEQMQRNTAPRLSQRSQACTQRVFKASRINLQLSNISECTPERTGFMAVSQSCGGRNALSFQRHAKLQHISPSVHQQTVVAGLKHQQVEDDIHCSDGKLYRGRMDAPLPPIHTKDVNDTKKHPIMQEKTTSLHRGTLDDRKQQEPMQKALGKREDTHIPKVDKTNKISPQLGNSSESIPKQADEPTLVSRTCGGRHTLTYFQRYAKLQGFTPSALLESALAGLKHQQVKADINGSDGKIYKGRMDADLTPNHTKNGNSKSQGFKKHVPTLDIITLAHLSQSEKPTGCISVRTNKVSIK